VLVYKELDDSSSDEEYGGGSGFDLYKFTKADKDKGKRFILSAFFIERLLIMVYI